MIPDEVPERLRSNALYPDAETEDWPAWPKADATAILDALRATTVSIEEVQAYELMSTGLVPIDQYWSMYTTVGATESERAMKSRAAAAAFIRQLQEDDGLYVGIRFSYQDDAA